jgi:hypothetical protein
MKALKISLTLIVIAVFGAGIFFWIKNSKPVEKLEVPQNQFTEKIVLEIKQLKEKPDNVFCKEFYNTILFHINEFYKQKSFGKNQLENIQWKETLESNLYVAYSQKFIKQSNIILGGSDWKKEDLVFIQAEKNELQRSKLLIVGSPVYNDLTNIQRAINKYYEIVNFIASCEGFVFLQIDLSARFPVADVQNMIIRSKVLINNRMENQLVNNCTRLQLKLREIPQSFFYKHIFYLNRKIDNSMGLFSSYRSFNEYTNLLYKPLKSEIESLDNNIYNVSNFDSEYDNLLKKLNSDISKAYNYNY